MDCQHWIRRRQRNSVDLATCGGSEDLLMAAVADCFVLSFRAIAAASKFNWISLKCEANGKLDRVDRKVFFTEIKIHASLQIPPDSPLDRAKNLLEKAEHTCFITNSLSSDKHLDVQIDVVEPDEN